MRDTHLFQLALGIDSPWFVSTSDFDAEGKRLDIEINFKSGSRSGHLQGTEQAVG